MVAVVGRPGPLLAGRDASTVRVERKNSAERKQTAKLNTHHGHIYIQANIHDIQQWSVLALYSVQGVQEVMSCPPKITVSEEDISGTQGPLESDEIINIVKVLHVWKRSCESCWDPDILFIFCSSGSYVPFSAKIHALQTGIARTAVKRRPWCDYQSIWSRLYVAGLFLPTNCSTFYIVHRVQQDCGRPCVILTDVGVWFISIHSCWLIRVMLGFQAWHDFWDTPYCLPTCLKFHLFLRNCLAGVSKRRRRWKIGAVGIKQDG